MYLTYISYVIHISFTLFVARADGGMELGGAGPSLGAPSREYMHTYIYIYIIHIVYIYIYIYTYIYI